MRGRAPPPERRVDLATLARWEWMLILLIVMGIPVWQLVPVIRAQKDRGRRK